MLAKKLDQAGASGDEELKAAAQALLGALEALKSDPQGAALFDFDRFRALKNFEVADVEILGTLFRAKDAVFEGDAKFIRHPSEAQPEEPAKNADAGGGARAGPVVEAHGSPSAATSSSRPASLTTS